MLRCATGTVSEEGSGATKDLWRCGLLPVAFARPGVGTELLRAVTQKEPMEEASTECIFCPPPKAGKISDMRAEGVLPPLNSA